MGKIAVTIVGTVIGAYFGYPQLGFLLGSLVGTLAFPDKGPNVHGPRLDNLMVTSSTFGQPIPIVYGTFRLAGNMIWSKGIREVSDTQSAGGKGGGGPTITNYSYRWSGAIGVCEGPIAGFLRIWADSKIVYDATGASPVANKNGFTFREYIGTEEQMPDPAWEAHVGAGNLSANRGMAYIVFDDIELQDYGNRVPNFTFEVAGNGSIPDTTGVEGVVDLVGGPVGAAASSFLLPDWDRNVFYRWPAGGAGIRVYDITTRQEVRQKESTEIFDPADEFQISFPGSTAVDDLGYIYSPLGTASNSAPFAKISPDTLVEVDRVGITSGGLDEAVDTLTPIHMSTCKAQLLTGAARFLVTCTLFGSMQVYNTDPMALIGFETIDPSMVAATVGAPSEEGLAVSYVVGYDQDNYTSPRTDPIEIHKLTISASAALLFNTGDGTNSGINLELLSSLSPQDIFPSEGTVAGWSHFSSFHGLFYDNQEDRLYFVMSGIFFSVLHASTSNKTLLVRYNPATSQVESTYELPFEPTGTAYMHYNKITNNRVAFVGEPSGSTSSVTVINLETGVIETTDGWDHDRGLGAQVYNGYTGEIVSVGTTLGTAGETTCVLQTGRRVSVAANLGDIVTDLCERAGLEASDIDVSELTDEVPGYLINGQMTVRSALEPLCLAYKFDGVETDYLLKFLKRGRALTLTITQDQLKMIDENSGDVIRETRIQEVDLPERVSVVYSDAERDYQQNTQTSKRVTNPTPTMFTKNQAAVTLPISLSATFAKQLSYTMLNVSWIERVATEFCTGWEFLKLDPTDSIGVSLDNGTVYTVRLIQADAGVDMSMQFQAVNERATAYEAPEDMEGDSGEFTSPTIPMLGLVRTFIIDSPLFRDSEDTGQTTTRMYTMAGDYGSGTPGVEVQKSADGSFYAVVAQILTACSWGACLNTIDEPFSAFLTDEVNTLTVHMFSGADDLESVTQLEMVNGANPAMIFNVATGVMEIIQYRDVTLNVDGTYTLSGLLRGRRGTDTYAYTHSGEEMFILLTDAAVETFSLSVSERNQERFYKGVQFGTFFDDAEIQAVTSICRPLMPYAPVNYEVVDNAGDFDITWERRTRLAGDLLDSIGTVPLAESSEAYSIDIYDPTGTTVLRTLTSATTTVTYLAADITTDFGTPPDEVILSIYQLSGAVGRGFAYKLTVPVT